MNLIKEYQIWYGNGKEIKNMKYKNIICYNSYGTWQADYQLPNGKRFALHRACCLTKKAAYELAKEQVDYLRR